MIPDTVHDDLEGHVSGEGRAGCHCYFHSDLAVLTCLAIKVRQWDWQLVEPNMAGEALVRIMRDRGV
jgi:hypothetical protein